MSQEENHGTRDLTYSAWHRRNSTRRYVGIENAQLLAMIDMDAVPYVEYDENTKLPLALIEAAIDVGQEWKPSTVTRELAKAARLPAAVVLYKMSVESNPADAKYRDIESFRVRRINPNEEMAWRIMTPKEYAEWLLKMRRWQSEHIDAGF